eukprot:GFYU01000357.1.p1 GENE.GFYU01000357.1~~GFYU01000357.1.p1  ORF type:complete len:307 (-),score=116.37 GFYU01000357.1:134-1054(-)
MTIVVEQPLPNTHAYPLTYPLMNRSLSSGLNAENTFVDQVLSKGTGGFLRGMSAFAPPQADTPFNLGLQQLTPSSNFDRQKSMELLADAATATAALQSPGSGSPIEALPQGIATVVPVTQSAVLPQAVHAPVSATARTNKKAEPTKRAAAKRRANKQTSDSDPNNEDEEYKKQKEANRAAAERSRKKQKDTLANQQKTIELLKKKNAVLEGRLKIKLATTRMESKFMRRRIKHLKDLTKITSQYDTLQKTAEDLAKIAYRQQGQLDAVLNVINSGASVLTSARAQGGVLQIASTPSTDKDDSMTLE